MALDAAMPTDTMTATANKLTVTNTGTYRIAYSVNATSDQNGEVKPYVRINNSEVEHSAVNGLFPAGATAQTAYPKDFQNSFLSDLNAGDQIDLAIEFPNAEQYPSFTLNIAANRALLHAIRIK